MRLHWPCLFLEPSMSWHAAYAQPSLAWPCKSDNTWKYSTQAWPTVLCIFADWHWKSPWLKTNVLRSLQKSIQCALRHRSQRLNCSRLLNDNVWSLLDNSLLQSFQAVILDSHIFSIGFATPFELQTDTHIDHLCTPCIVAHQILLLHSQIRPQTKFSSPLQSLHWGGVLGVFVGLEAKPHDAGDRHVLNFDKTHCFFNWPNLFRPGMLHPSDRQGPGSQSCKDHKIGEHEELFSLKVVLLAMSFIDIWKKGVWQKKNSRVLPPGLIILHQLGLY